MSLQSQEPLSICLLLPKNFRNLPAEICRAMRPEGLPPDRIVCLEYPNHWCQILGFYVTGLIKKKKLRLHLGIS